MRRAFITAAAVLMGVSGSLASSLDTRAPIEILEALRLPPISTSAPQQCAAQVQMAQACCRRCSRGKPCGDSCISRDKQCHKGPGCAC